MKLFVFTILVDLVANTRARHYFAALDMAGACAAFCEQFQNQKTFTVDELGPVYVADTVVEVVTD